MHTICSSRRQPLAYREREKKFELPPIETPQHIAGRLGWTHFYPRGLALLKEAVDARSANRQRHYLVVILSRPSEQ